MNHSSFPLMNPSTNQASVAVDELAPPPQPQRLSTSCDVHPDERFSGFCPSCLCERLTVLDHNDALPESSSSPRKPPTISAAALKALFKPSSGNNNGNGRIRPSFFPELRRTKSFSVKNNEGFSAVAEPQRRSCDVRLREEHRDITTKEVTVASGGNIEDESSMSEAVHEVNEEEAQIEKEKANGSCPEIVTDSGEITEEKSNEIFDQVEEIKLMKDHMDLYPQTKKPSVKDFAGSFWSAASVFSKKLQRWRQKQKIKKPRSDGSGRRSELPVEKATTRKFRDTQSEVADYGCGRRSGDTDPRFSLDAGRFSVDIGRISLDDPRCSLVEPRSSWDGNLIGRTALTTMARIPPPPSMLSVVEDAPVRGSDMQIEVEVPSSPSISPINSEPDPTIIIPGGSNQTRDYYTGPPSRRRKSLDKSISIRKTVEPMVDDVKSTVVRDDCSMETSENKSNQSGDKKSRRWGKWSILGFIYRKGINKDDEEDMYSRSNSTGMVERSLSDSWPGMRNEGGGPKMKRSNSNVSWRSSGGASGKHKSCIYSPKNGEKGMLRFYLTPMSSCRTRGSDGGSSGAGWKKTAARANSHGHSIAKRVMRLY